MGDIEEEDIWRYGRRVVDSLMFHSQTLSETTSWCVDHMKVCGPDFPTWEQHYRYHNIITRNIGGF